MQKTILRKSHQHWQKRENGTLRVFTKDFEPTKTSQEFKDDCDPNNIVRKFKQDGILTHMNKKAGVYADLTNIPSYQEALNTVIQAQNAFETLPSQIRKQFNNSPQEFVEFMQDPKNHDKAADMGLVERKNDDKLNDDKKAPKKGPKTPAVEADLDPKN